MSVSNPPKMLFAISAASSLFFFFLGLLLVVTLVSQGAVTLVSQGGVTFAAQGSVSFLLGLFGRRQFRRSPARDRNPTSLTFFLHQAGIGESVLAALWTEDSSSGEELSVWKCPFAQLQGYQKEKVWMNQIDTLVQTVLEAAHLLIYSRFFCAPAGF
jgi:hypothetical protein